MILATQLYPQELNNLFQLDPEDILILNIMSATLFPMKAMERPSATANQGTLE
jgi:hypothetical protein